MSLLNTPLWKVILSSFSLDVWKRITPSIQETLYMTVIASVIMLVFGLLIGILLTVTNPNGLAPKKELYSG